MFKKRSEIVFLIGFMAAGKSTVGPLLARQWGWTFLDLDQQIERRVGQSIEDIFNEGGEAVFRDHETQTLAQVSTLTRRVVAVGGGAPAFERNWPYLRRGLSVYLALSLEQLWTRLKTVNRPMLDGLDGSQRLERARQLLQARLPSYRRSDLRISADGTPLAVAQRIAREVASCNW